MITTRVRAADDTHTSALPPFFVRFRARCSNATWVTDTLERYGPLTPDDCRLYEPMEKPQ